MSRAHQELLKRVCHNNDALERAKAVLHTASIKAAQGSGYEDPCALNFRGCPRRPTSNALAGRRESVNYGRAMIHVRNPLSRGHPSRVKPSGGA
ncbi:hypothetical protein C8Q78DRAFT_1032174, partial [Trametes maxima]